MPCTLDIGSFMTSPSSDTEDQKVDVHDACVPPGIRAEVLSRMEPGDALWRCPRSTRSSQSRLAAQGGSVIEWWLVDSDGELVEAFWEERTPSRHALSPSARRNGSPLGPVHFMMLLFCLALLAAAGGWFKVGLVLSALGVAVFLVWALWVLFEVFVSPWR